MNSGPFGKGTAFRVGKMEASCPACGGTEFARSRRLRQEKADALACTKCGAEHPRNALLQQITQKVIEQADLALRRSNETLQRAVQPAELAGKLKEAEELLQFPAVEGHVERATKLLTSIARATDDLEVRKAAMLAIGLVAARARQGTFNADATNLQRLLAQMREALARRSPR